MRRQLPLLAITGSWLVGGCAGEWTTFPGPLVDLCAEFNDQREIGWEELTAKGVTPTQAVESHATPALVSGEMVDWVDRSTPSVTFSFDADTAVDPSERYWDDSEAIPDHCQRPWQLRLPTTAEIAIDHGSLPPVGGSGSIRVGDDGDDWSCAASFSTWVHDRGASTAWFDFVEDHLAAARPTRVELFVRSACDGSDASIFVEYQAIVDGNHVAGGEVFSFEAER